MAVDLVPQFANFAEQILAGLYFDAEISTSTPLAKDAIELTPTRCVESRPYKALALSTARGEALSCHHIAAVQGVVRLTR